MSRRRQWDNLPMVFITEAACPYCMTPRPALMKSLPNGDDSTTRRCVCRECNRRFVVVVELPEFGDSVIWPSTMAV